MRLIDQGLDAIIQNQPDLGGLALGGAIAAGFAALGWATVGWVDPNSQDSDPNDPWVVLGYTLNDDGEAYRFETAGQALDWALANPRRGMGAVVFDEEGFGIGPQLSPICYEPKWAADRKRVGFVVGPEGTCRETDQRRAAADNERVRWAAWRAEQGRV